MENTIRTYRIHGKEYVVNEENYNYNTGTELNSDATLKEVKEKVGSSRSFKRCPGTVYLRSCGNLVAATTSAGCRMEVYDNGFAIYQTQDAAAVLRMEHVGSCYYEGDQRVGLYDQNIDLSDTAWVVAVMMKGEESLEKWRSEHDTNKPVSLCEAGDRNEETGEMTELEIDAGVDVEKTVIDGMSAEMLIKCLSKRQKDVLNLLYNKGMTLREVGNLMGITKKSVYQAVRSAKMRIKNR